MAGCTRIAHQPVAGIGDERRAGIADQHDDLIRHPRHQPRPRRIIGMIIIGAIASRFPATVMAEQQLEWTSNVIRGPEELVLTLRT